ncbi:hypothetical protein O0I10_001647 [Lichtheimia ornata]|uniref:Uncharacterized protein n=1 Tax=Lichtheimia ornata TaxID=688661 RepID=A0AAD7VCD1_9FUNG|nr:uncharacterized protein O0I10_001647 [Lichtheimia ornata]KAJ8662683.1 hypothetical protein O0I10_001647 [Lichtheimia ornata]
MNTPPPEQDTFIKPDPFFSVSTPIVPLPNTTTTASTVTTTGSSSRPRRYTQPTRTAPKDERHFEKEDNHDDELDRISDILANLIREANDAVHGLERERGKILEQQQQRRSVRTSSRLPRPKSFSSSSSLIATSSSSNNTMSVPPPHPPLRRRPFPPPHPPPIETAPLLESFQRLDTSMAMVDSLSRDLSSQQEHQQHDHFTALFIVPLLHIPHALITTLFNAAPPSLSGMVAWACLFALGNLIMGPNNNMDNSRRLSLPGAYHDDDNKTNLAGRDDDDDDEDLQQQPMPTTTTSTTSPSRIITTTTTSVRKRRPTIVRRSIYRKRAPLTSRQSMMPLSSQPSSSKRSTILVNTTTTATATAATGISSSRNTMPLSPNQQRRRNSV